MNIAVFASGRGSNFSAIAQAINKGSLKCSIVLLVCDDPKAAVIAKAKKARVPVLIASRDDFRNKEDFEAAIEQALIRYGVELVVLAGFMRILSKKFARKYYGRLINIHPSLLPAFKGAHAINDAFDYGVKTTGVTVHFVDELTDHGPIILQEAVPVDGKDDLARLEQKIHKIEHVIYPRAIKLFCQKRLIIRGRKVLIKPR